MDTHKTNDEGSIILSNDELEASGFELCEFTGECEQCGAEGELFFHRTTYEVIEGDYYCRSCSTKMIMDA